MNETKITVFAIDARDANWLAEYFAVAFVDDVGIIASHASFMTNCIPMAGSLNGAE